MSYNGFSNYETWLVNLWFGDHWTCQADVEESREYIEDMIAEQTQQMPDWMVDLSGLNHIDNEVNWDELKAHLDEEETVDG